MAKTQVIQGTWHPTGFHGHFRSKSRLDFVNEYRHLAKPAPPRKFSKRTQDLATSHLFSKHDNRNSFMNDAMYFEQGLGRRRFQNNNNNKWQPEFLAWLPHKEKPDPKKKAPFSVYRVDYRGSCKEPEKQYLISRPKTSFDENRDVTTTYRYSHGRDNPNRDVLNAMCNTSLTTAATAAKATSQSSTYRRMRSSSAQPPSRDTVANCMNWYVPPIRRSCIVPASTATVVSEHIPAPPPVTKTVLHYPAPPPPRQDVSANSRPFPVRPAPVPVEVSAPQPAPVSYAPEPAPAPPQQAKVMVAACE